MLIINKTYLINLAINLLKYHILYLNLVKIKQISIKIRYFILYNMIWNLNFVHINII